MIAFLTSAALIASYDCQLEKPRAIGFDEQNVTGSEIGLPPMALKFSIAFHSGDPMEARINWPGDPMQAAGTFPVIATAPNAYAFSAFSGGPCLFTEQACATQSNLVETANSKASLIVTPVALSQDTDTKARFPFAVVARGQCARTDLKS